MMGKRASISSLLFCSPRKCLSLSLSLSLSLISTRRALVGRKPKRTGTGTDLELVEELGGVHLIFDVFFSSSSNE